MRKEPKRSPEYKFAGKKRKLVSMVKLNAKKIWKEAYFFTVRTSQASNVYYSVSPRGR